ncbi:MAG: peptidoglycan DD-metalloendopeptidase family protein [Candidatus Gracilibacteria bacterium]|nr:peptidoglycan DD-metalloendopeptidase family protein [Candidatus Gracilibacteria bacterium]
MKQTKNTLTLALLIIYFLTSINLANAGELSYSKNIRALILEKFKKEQYNNIYQNDNPVLTKDINFFDTQSKINIYENIKQSNLDKKEELVIQKNVVESRVLNLEETIKLLDEDIENTTKEILSLSRKIISVNGQIETSQTKINDLNKEIYQNKLILLDYIAHIYKKQNLASGSNELDSLKTVLLNNDNLSDVISDLHFSTILEATGQILLEKHKKLVKELFVKALELKKQKQELKDNKEQSLLKRKEQTEKKEFREKILDFTKGKQELFEKFIQDKLDFDRKIKIKILQNKLKLIRQKQEVLDKYNCKYINNFSGNYSSGELYLDDESFSGKTSEDNCLFLNRILTLESQLKPVGSDNAPLLWPVNPKSGLSAYFNDPNYQDEVGSTHDAIDIRVPQGTDIVAPADGYITYVREPNDEGYAYVVLKHTDGYITVYGHVSEVLFKQYDLVKAGEVFAKSGGEFGTNGSGIMTTGPHLHFEVRKDKEVVDPLMYLDLTKLGFEKIPNVEKYIDKFQLDYESKYGYKYGGDANIIDMIRGFEGFRDVAYQDSVGVWTIGYGFTSINQIPVKEGDTITLDEAEGELVKKSKYYTNWTNFVKVPLTKEQQTALTSFEYNLGRNIWTKDTSDGGAMPIIDMINVGDLVGAAEYLKEFNSAGGKDLKGLTNRRIKEANLLLSGMDIDTSDIQIMNMYIENGDL